MVDANYIVDIHLRAHDDTGQAYAQAAGNAEEWRKRMDEHHEAVRNQNRQTRESFDDIALSQKQIADVSTRTGQTVAGELRKLQKGQSEHRLEIERNRQALIGYEEELKKVGELEDGTWKRAKGASNKVFDERLKQFKDTEKAIVDLSRKVDEWSLKERELQALFSRDERPNQIERTIVRVQQLSRTLAALNANEKASEQERINAQKELAATRRDLQILMSKEREVGAALKDQDAKRAADAIQAAELETALLREREKVMQRIEATARKIATTTDVRDAERLGEALATNERLLTQLGMRGAEARKHIQAAADAAKDSQFQRALENQTRQYQQQARVVEQIARLQREREQRVAAGAGTERVDIDIREAERKLIEITAAIKGISLQDLQFNVDVDATDAEAQILVIEAMKAHLAKSVGFDVDAHVAKAVVDLAALEAAKQVAASDVDVDVDRGWWGRLREQVGGVSQAFHNASGSISSFDNFMRGLMTLAIAAFLGPIIIAVGALGGALVAVASSAVMAGAALGGALAAGAAQALPFIGLLAAALARVKAVMDVVQQADLLRQQTASRGQATDNQQAARADAVRNALDGVADANRRVADAEEELAERQRELNQVRRDAVIELEELILKEREAELAARGAALSEEEALRRRQQATMGGTGVLGFMQADVSYQQSVVGTDQSRLRARQQAGETRAAVRGGIEALPSVEGAREGVENAEEALEDARRAADRAERSLQNARRSAAASGAESLAAAGKLNYMMGELSHTERRMVKAIQNLREEWAKVMRPITDIILGSFIRTINRITTVIGRNDGIQAFTRMARGIATSINRVVDAFTSNRAIEQWLRIVRQSTDNLKPLTDLAINLGKAFWNIAEAAGPSFRRILGWLVGLTDSFAKLTSQQGKMRSFFSTATDHFMAWMRLGGGILKLFGAIMGAGAAESGLRIIDRMTAGLNRMTKWVNENPQKVEGFFRTVEEALSIMWPVVTALAQEMAKLFTPEGLQALQGFADFLIQAIIPAFGIFIDHLMEVTEWLGDFVKTPFGREVTKWTIALALLGGIAMKIGTIFKPIVAIIVQVVRVFAPLISYFVRFSRAATALGLALQPGITMLARFRILLAAIGGPIGAVVGVIALLVIKFRLLDDIWRGLKRGFEAFIKPIKPAFEELKKAFADAGVNFGGFGDALDKMRPVMEWLVRRIMPVVTGFFRMLGPPIAFAIRLIAGFVRTIGHLIDAFEALFRGDIKGFFSSLGKAILNGLLTPFKALGQLFLDIFKTAWNAILEFFGVRSPARKAMELGMSIVQGLLNAFVDIGRFFLDIGKKILTAIWDGIKSVFGFITDLPGMIFGAIWDGITGIGDKFLDIGKKIAGFISDGIKKGKEMFNDAVDWLTGGDDKKVEGEPLRVRVAAELSRDNRMGPRPTEGAAQRAMSASSTRSNRAGLSRRPSGRRLEGQLTERGTDAVVTVSFGTALSGIEEFSDKFGAAWRSMWSAIRSRTDRAVVNVSESIGRIGNALNRLRRRMNEGGFGIDFSEALKTVNIFRVVFIGRWTALWAVVEAHARRGRRSVVSEVRQMVDDLEKLTGRMFRSVNKNFELMQNWAKRRATDMYKGVGGSISALERVVYRGMSYISRTANKALESFDADPVAMSLQSPKNAESRAVGGFMGAPGERGRDKILTYLGRGEAVLNWAHQKAIAPALEFARAHGVGPGSLQDVFRTRAYHAGGPGTAPGYARGGIVPIPGMTGEFIAKPILPALLSMLKKFRALVTDGWASGGHSRGSDHYWGGAVDLVPASGGSWGLLDRLAKAAGWRPDRGGVPVGGPFRWIGWNTEANHGAPPRPNAHLHLSWNRGGPYIGPAGTFDTDVPKREVKGGTAMLRELGQAIYDKVRGAANAFLENEMEQSIDSISFGRMAGGVMSRGEVSGVVRKAMDMLNVPEQLRGGWLSMALKRAWQESTFNPNAINNWDSNAAAGDPSRGLFQTIGATFRSYALPGHNNIYNALDNTVAAFRYMLARYGQGNWARALSVMNSISGGYAFGGVVPGLPGQEKLIRAHGDEWVLNPTQQSRVAGSLGLSREKLRDWLGFRGGPTSYQGGGETKNAPGLPSWHALPTDWLTARHERRQDEFTRRRERLEEAHEARMRRLRGKAHENERDAEEKRYKARLARVNKEAQEEEKAYKKRMSTFEGVFERMSDRWNSMLGWEQRYRAQRQGLYVAPPIAPESFRETRREARRGVRAMRNAQGHPGARWLDRFTTTVSRVVDEDGVLAQMFGAIERNVENWTRNLQGRSFKFGKGGGITRRGGINADLVRLEDEIEIGWKEYGQLQQAVSLSRETFRKINRRLQTVRRQIRRIERDGRIDESERDDYRRLQEREGALTVGRRRAQEAIRNGQGRLNDILAEQYERQVQRFEAQVSRNVGRTDRRLARIDFEKRFAELMGNRDAVFGKGGLVDQEISQMQYKLSQLKGFADEAARMGMPEQERALRDQIQELELSIIEATVGKLNSAIEWINEEADKRLTGLERWGRLADLTERGGDAVGAARMRGAIEAGRLDVHRDKLAMQEQALSVARLMNNTAAIETLSGQIADTKIAIAEAELAVRDSTAVTRQALLDRITSRQQFRTGIFGGLMGILETVGAIEGTDRYNKAREEMTESEGQDLRSTGEQLRQEFLSGYGVDLRGLRGADFVSRVRQLDLDRMMAGMTQVQRQTFENLINAIIENEAAVQSNTQALNEIRGTMLEPQSWSSSAWTMFRTAIFNGMGQLLPQYQMPIASLQTGGVIRKRGIFELEPGEAVLRPHESNQVINEGDLVLNIHEAGQPVDVDHIFGLAHLHRPTKR